MCETAKYFVSSYLICSGVVQRLVSRDSRVDFCGFGTMSLACSGSRDSHLSSQLSFGAVEVTGSIHQGNDDVVEILSDPLQISDHARLQSPTPSPHVVRLDVACQTQHNLTLPFGSYAPCLTKEMLDGMVDLYDPSDDSDSEDIVGIIGTAILDTTTDELPYVCDVCGRPFALPEQVFIHKNSHNHWPKFRCDGCGCYLSTKSLLSKHRGFTCAGIREVTGKKPQYRCDICHQLLFTKRGLINHLRDKCGRNDPNKHTADKDLCDLCGSFMPHVTFLRHRRLKCRRDQATATSQAARSSDDPPTPGKAASSPAPSNASSCRGEAASSSYTSSREERAPLRMTSPQAQHVQLRSLLAQYVQRPIPFSMLDVFGIKVTQLKSPLRRTKTTGNQHNAGHTSATEAPRAKSECALFVCSICGDLALRRFSVVVTTEHKTRIVCRSCVRQCQSATVSLKAAAKRMPEPPKHLTDCPRAASRPSESDASAIEEPWPPIGWRGPRLGRRAPHLYLSENVSAMHRRGSPVPRF